MSRRIFQPEWRTHSRRKRRFYARYMGWLEKTGYVVVTLLVAGFVGSFFYEVDEWVTADEVPIEAAVSLQIVSDREGTLTRVLATAGERVEIGEPLFQLRTPDGPALVVAERAGVFVPSAGPVPLAVTRGQALGSLREYGRLIARASLAGKSVANASVGQRAEFSGVKVPGPGSTLLRLNYGGKAIVSQRLADTAVREALERALLGKTVLAREDRPLTVSKVGDIEVEAALKASPDGAAAIAPDPSPDLVIAGKVEEGNPVLSAQLADLPDDVREAASRALRERLTATGIGLDAKTLRVENVLDPRFVVKLTADKPGSAGAAIPVATVKRSFEAVVSLDPRQVPDSLRDAVRSADANGRAVTARVRVRTGSRPIAYFLLRRS